MLSLVKASHALFFYESTDLQDNESDLVGPVEQGLGPGAEQAVTWASRFGLSLLVSAES